MTKKEIRNCFIIFLIIIFLCFLGFLLGSKINRLRLKERMEKDQTFYAKITEINDKSIVVKGIDSNEKDFRNKSFVLDLTQSTSYTWKKENILLIHFNKGDKVSVTFKGEATEKYPTRIERVGNISLLEEYKTRKLVKVNGKLYYDTNKKSKIKNRCGVMDGIITKMVSRNEIPVEDNTSNFGMQLGYQIIKDHTIEILIDGKWIIFEQKV